MKQNPMWKPAIISGVLIGMLSAIPPFSLVNCLCCAWLIGGGVLAAFLYVRNSPAAVTLGSGALLGAIAGGIGGASSVLFGIPVRIIVQGLFADYLEEARRVVADIPNLPPSVIDMLNASAGRESVLTSLLYLPFFVVLYGIVTTLGGVLGVAVFEKRKPGGSDDSLPPPISLPPPPPAPEP
jgi:hypothetical protein